MTLTAREFDVLRLLSKGKTSKEIAATLCLSVQTVATHRKNICKKIGVHSTAELIAWAFSHSAVSTEGGY